MAVCGLVYLGLKSEARLLTSWRAIQTHHAVLHLVLHQMQLHQHADSSSIASMLEEWENM